jgi:exodeoxyribonuclease III
LEFNAKIQKFLNGYRRKGKNILICGDFNVAHQEIDLKNPRTNHENPGFLPEEREWMSQFLESGYVDLFRKFEPGPGHYTWWSYRPGVRQKNVGWRIDYWCSNEELSDRLKSSRIHCEVYGSDHCPVELRLKK